MTCVVNGAPTVKECELQFYSATIFIKNMHACALTHITYQNIIFTWFPILNR